MNKIAVSIFLATIVMSVACDDDDADVIIIDTDNDGIADDLEPPPPGVLDFSNTANFGRITALRLGSNDQRQIQLAVKYYF